MMKSKLISYSIGLGMLLGAGSLASAAELPADDPGLFTYLFTEKTIPANWIAAPASDELTPAMMSEIADRLSREGGQYQSASKTAKGWRLDFQNGTARARILRAPDRTLVGVFFSKLE